MKVLTIKQPFANLIIENKKVYEFRTWKTNYRGKILIHAGLNIDKPSFERLKKYTTDILTGYIIGEAEIVDCLKCNEDFKNKCLKINKDIYKNIDCEKDYAWKLINIKKYSNPIKIKGKLGLWNYDATENIQKEPDNM